MNVIRLASAIVLVSLMAAGCGRTPAQPESTGPALDRSCVVASAADAGNDPDIARLQQQIRERRDIARAAEQVGYRFISRARLTNDSGYYKVAEQSAACVESVAPADPTALLLRGHALHQMHQFKDAEAIARRLVAMREFVLDFGLLGDVLMEQGRLREAGEAYQKMIDLKPFYQSYTRAAHLRWLKGDLTGAIALMRKAVAAASPRDRESVAWAYTRLASYELQQGRFREAAQMVDSALGYVPEYAAALLVRGRIELAQSRPASAVAALTRAAELNAAPDYQWALADALRSAGRATDAAVIEQRLRNDGAAGDPRTFSLYLATRRQDGDTAVELARRELDSRQDIFTIDALAWALASAGRPADASALMTRALAEGTQDARLYLHAAVIAAANGRSADAARYASRARALRFMLLPSELGVLQRGLVAPPRA